MSSELRLMNFCFKQNYRTSSLWIGKVCFLILLFLSSHIRAEALSDTSYLFDNTIPSKMQGGEDKSGGEESYQLFSQASRSILLERRAESEERIFTSTAASEGKVIAGNLANVEEGAVYVGIAGIADKETTVIDTETYKPGCFGKLEEKCLSTLPSTYSKITAGGNPFFMGGEEGGRSIEVRDYRAVLDNDGTSSIALPQAERESVDMMVLSGIFAFSKTFPVVANLEGKILSMSTLLGGRLNIGNILLRFDCLLLENEIEQARLQHHLAKLSYKEEVNTKHLTPNQMAILRTQVEIALAHLNLLRLKAQECSVYAPFNGIVLEQKVHAGERVQRNQHLMTLAEDSPLHFRFLFPVSKISWLFSGMLFTVYTTQGNVPVRFLSFERPLDMSEEQVLASAMVVSAAQDFPFVGLRGDTCVFAPMINVDGEMQQIAEERCSLKRTK